ncbi:hypothetical protein EJB05_57941, partial [Eragrostis curvula]
MGFGEAVRWWEEWQMRLLVLSSLILQYFLYITAVLRKHRTAPLFKSITWLAYLLSDAIAIYALATLFNRHKKQEWLLSPDGRTAGLELLWVPILLLHLGGQDNITAYSIEDNELWRRHFLTAASQVSARNMIYNYCAIITVGIYVFRKSWSGRDKRLLEAAILLFIPGILKCLEKPWALKRACISSMAISLGSRKDEDSEEYTTGSTEPNINSLEDYVKAASEYVNMADDKKQVPDDHQVKDVPDNLFVDLPYPYSVRLKNIKYIISKTGYKAHLRVQSSLSRMFSRLYTKYKVCGSLIRALLVVLTFVAIRLFHMSHRDAYDVADVKVTYALLCCTAALECISVITMVCFRSMSKAPWPDQVAQCNLIGYLARDMKQRRFRRLVSLLGWDRYLDRFWCMATCRSPSSPGITKLIHGHINLQWKERIKEVTSYRKFNESRGQWTVFEVVKCGDKQKIESSLRRPFDESVILWHLATEFCFFDRVDTGREETYHCRRISNYMVYLLLMNPEMLMPGARRRIFWVAYDQLRGLLKEEPADEGTELTEKIKIPLRGREDITRKIIQKVKKSTDGDLVREAWELAQDLMDLENNDQGAKTWKVIHGVWVEMICFSASRCRGFLHAKSLGKGGEYLSYVWLLREYMGMETLAQRMQRPDLEFTEAGDLGATAPKSTPIVTVTVNK